MTTVLDRVKMVENERIATKQRNDSYLRRLKDLVASYEWTQKEVAFIFEVSQPTVANMLSGKTPISEKVIDQIDILV